MRKLLQRPLTREIEEVLLVNVRMEEDCGMKNALGIKLMSTLVPS